ncbi:MAG: KpsF/GutQ family sugar-phosphate isomerase [Phycisphaera sp.]|nr:KpsF/GutQ family sugar-phosphate isomerase [Phycisphaera sp.]
MAESRAPAASDPHVRSNERAFLVEALRTEADAVGRFADRVASDAVPALHAALDLLESCRGHVVVSGMGKSGLVGAKISASLSSLGQPSHFVHPAEAVHGDLGSIRADDVVMLLSWSGETQEVVALGSILKMDGIPTVGLSSRPGSSLARVATVHIDLGDLTEACPLNLAPTASTTLTLAVGDALALALASRRDFGKDDFHKHHPGGMLGAGLRPVTEVLRFRVGKNLAAVPDTSSVREALRAAGEGRRAGAIVLVDAAGRLSGIFTDGDLRRHVNGGGLSALDSPISTVMTRHPTTLSTDSLVRDAVQLVQERRLDEIPVVDRDGKPVGLVDIQDLIAMRVVRE